MRASFFIARRYLFSKKSRNIINIISFISLFGISVATAAMIIVLSAFNGIEETVIGLYDDYDQDITIKLKEGKSINEQNFPIEKLETISGIKNMTRVIEEVVILKHHDKWANAKIYGVDTIFLSMSNMRGKVMDSMPALLHEREMPLAMLGAGLFDKLGVYLSLDGDYDRVHLYAPYREAKSNHSQDAFSTMDVRVVSRFNFNKDVNDKFIVVPIELARSLLKYDNDISFYALQLDSSEDLEDKKEEIKNVLGEEFVVKTRYEKNELIYKTSKAEKLISIIVLCFIFLLATFNMIASLSMLFLEKQKDIETLKSMGADQKFVFRIFFAEGMMINVLGMLFGLFYGTAVCLLQMKYGWLKVQNNQEEVIPVVVKYGDFILISSLILVLGAFACWIPVKILMKRSRVFS